ncbi:MAG: hypothetical protein KDK08_26055 [Rhizobiaceae bacterium]|nr:hypothetical protein [Rhizobiaceae bacterium]
MTNDDPEIEVSPLSGMVTHDGVTVDVQIYRIAGSGDGWFLDVVSTDGASTVWDDPFPTDEAAHAEFNRALKEEGILAIIAGDQPTVH